MKTLEVIQEVRKKLNDYDRIECPLAVETLLESIRDTLDDREVSGEYNISDLIQELKDANGDTVEKGAFTDSEIILAEILDQLGDNAQTIKSFSYPFERLIEELRVKLNDSQDSPLPETVSEKVREKLPGNGIADTESASDTAILENVRLNLNDSVEPYRWETERLNEYISAGKEEIRFRRNDVTGSGVGKRFESALIAYTTARAFEHEAEDQSDASRCQAYWKTFESELKNAPFAWTDSELSGAIAEAITVIQSRRFAKTVGSRYEQSIISFALMRAFERGRPFGANEEMYQHYLTKFESDLNATPSARSDQEYRDLIEDAIRDIIRRRPDCKKQIYKASSDILLLNDKFVPAIILHVTGRLNPGGNFELFHKAVADIPFQWDEEILKRYMEDGILWIYRDFMRGTRGTDADGKLQCPECFRALLTAYVLSRAYEYAFSFSDSSEKIKIYRERFEAEQAKCRKLYEEEEYRRIIFDAARDLTGLALEDTGDHELPVDERHVPAILQYALFRFALRNGDLDAAGNLFALYLQLKASLPKHWTDEELLKFLNSAVREIIRRRPDCKECEYTEIGMDDTIPVSDKFETSLISYSVVRALEESGKKNVTEQHGYHVKKYEDGLSVIPRHRTDSDLLEAINIACREIFRIRPDLRLDRNGLPTKRFQGIISPEDEFPLADSLMPAVAAHSAARCIEEDNGNENRIIFFNNEFKKIVRGDI